MRSALRWLDVGWASPTMSGEARPTADWDLPSLSNAAEAIKKRYNMKRYTDLVADVLTRVKEIQPWDLSKQLAAGRELVLLDVREPAEFATLRIPGSINVPRGVLEQSCEWDYDETVPLLAAGRELEVVVVCRSGKRSALAADVLLSMGYTNVVSLKTGVRGWNDYEQPLVDGADNPVDADTADALLGPRLRPDQHKPKAS